jgi:comEA protein
MTRAWLVQNSAPTAWTLMVLGVVANMVFLLWPSAPQWVTVRPHPATGGLMAPVMMAGGATSLETLQDNGAVIAQGGSRRHARSGGKKVFHGVLNLNQATPAELQQLPGIGPKMASRILAYRKANGPFHSAEELLNVSGIGPKKLAKLAPHCRF